MLGDERLSKTTIKNPILWADIPDVDPIRVEDTYYMVSTSMHVMPGCPILKSKDLLNWEIVNYVYDILEDNESHNLMNGKNIYGKGSWAASLREHKGLYYVCFSSNDMQRFYIFRTDDIEKGKWQRSVINGIFHDPSLLFDEERVFVIYGNGDIFITELTADVTGIKPDGLNQLLLETKREGIGLRCEGCHAYKINGYYYLLFIEWPLHGNQRRREVCYRSTELLGPYERKIVLDDNMDYCNHGVAQGGIIDTTDQSWYALLFQDHDAVGRIPFVLPVRWVNDWPMMGIDGKAPEHFEVDLPYTPSNPLVISDDFDYKENQLALNWQWNHNPDHRFWSVTVREGFLRLTTGNVVNSVLEARNTLTQRTEGPACKGSVRIDLSNMKPGDHAGLIALQNTFGTVGIQVNTNGEKNVIMCINNGEGFEQRIEKVPYVYNWIDLKIEFNFENSLDKAHFFYSIDGETWNKIGCTLEMKYTLDHFMGYRIGLFNYASQETGGYADFDYFHYEKSIVGNDKPVR